MTRSPGPRIVCSGLTTLDVISLVEAVPGANSKTVALDSLVAAGGPAANAAVCAAALGSDVTLVTRLPDHPLTVSIRDDLSACGVEVVAGPSSAEVPVVASILVTQATGERAVVSPSASASAGVDVPVELPSLEGVGAVLVDGYYPETAIALARAARSRGIPVVMDAGSLKPHTARVAAECDVVVASGDFTTPAGSGSPDAVFAFFASLGVEGVAITRGGDPVLYRTPSGEGAVPVAPVTVADTLGAGDFFHGALAHRLAAQGLDDDRFAEDLAWASDVAGRSLGSFGTRAWLAGIRD